MSVREQFSSLTPGRQLLIAVGLVAVVSGLLAAGYFLLVRQPYETLFSDLRPADAATIKAELDKRKTPYKLADGGATILAPRGVVDATRLDIMSQDLPLKGAVGFELFNKSDIGLTEFAQKINYQRALQGELARTIMTLESVDSARVHLSMPDPTIFREDRRPSKASVTLTTRKGKTLSMSTVRGIQRLVSAAAPDMEAASVAVLDANGVLLNGYEVSPTVPMAPSSAKPDERAAIEQYYAARISRALEQQRPSAVSQVVVRIGEPTAERLENWTPAARTFPLSVDLETWAAEPAAVEQDLRRIASVAAGIDAARGDTVQVVLAEPGGLVSAQPRRVAPAMATTAKPWTSEVPRGDPVVPILAGVLLILVLAAGFLTWLGRRRVRPMSAQQREAYIAKFNAALDKRDAHVAP